ncbi:Coenzyme F420 hydrogenase/dehydrogenase, beta subunit C-terminal domain [Clostridium estertheticum]|uniref:Coenzyme F420 hydrogenase/dehydrogenase, beta subunit C-terminal domain n=1 Tax=Clostridium estertheticum TaxID=238834 RepID=UPI0013E93A27|nr:Coenzyme F420 hydrogenase/dehydrogenase, beta subunit C-terminal domain [Clostridium estertheticum]MBZ9689224.1 Coenzyme F420 hydrogenase/dehydrogenase, beta subunit C-terminal domain [Clostridium estertheticum]
MIKIMDKKDCSGCKACYNICPRNCIEMKIDGEGFWYPKVEVASCVGCGLCESVCPELNIYKNSSSSSRPTCIAAWNVDKATRENSSSGGVFTSIAEWILDNDGVVFGAAYDKKRNVMHTEVREIEDLSELRGSKYVQSDINTTYNSAKKYLDKGKKVLYTGTPCQIAGLYNFLQKEYAELYTCDIVCYGVPSPIVFQKYKKNLEQEYNSNISGITFRNKKNGWKSYSVAIQFENGSEYSKTFINDAYMKGFLRNYYLRPSCYKCSYAKLPRISDITLGDFWGVASKYPELYDDDGTSLLLINTAKGKSMIDACKNNIEHHECDLEVAIAGNPSIISSVKEPKKRQRFFEDLHNRDFNYIIKKYMSPPTWIERKIIFGVRVLRFMKKRILKLLKK